MDTLIVVAGLLKGLIQGGGSLSFSRLVARCRKQHEYKARKVLMNLPSPDGPFPVNGIRNQKYSLLTFLPLVFLEQFQFFGNLYFLIVAITQLFPILQVNEAWVAWLPLLFVIFVTMVREAYDDLNRYWRDKQLNNVKYEKLTSEGFRLVKSSDLQVGDLIRIHKDDRIPADLLLLRSSDRHGTCFVRTDQLDGETDWKMRLALHETQKLATDADLLNLPADAFADKPQQDINQFLGTFSVDTGNHVKPLIHPVDIENTLWSGTTLATGTAIGIVVYTGFETRIVMNTTPPESKYGLLDKELNNYMKLLFTLTFVLSAAMTLARETYIDTAEDWFPDFIRYIVLLSNIIPISLRVNIDMAKIVYAWFVYVDKTMKGALVRNTTITEELGRISYLLSDKTGTLTKNEMIFKKLHLGTVAFSAETFEEIGNIIELVDTAELKSTKLRPQLNTRLMQAVAAIALCHNVTPYFENAEYVQADDDIDNLSQPESEQSFKQQISYQGASPDEMALVFWASSVGVQLISRDLHSISLRMPRGQVINYKILHIFPFTSEAKRMGIILKDSESGVIQFIVKGADSVMREKVSYNDWLDEETSNMAREGLRTLCVARKILSESDYDEFTSNYKEAKIAIQNRNEQVAGVVRELEEQMQLLCITGVEDMLQDNVRTSIELLQGAGIKIWMITGDKMETAEVIAKSSGIFNRMADVWHFPNVTGQEQARIELEKLSRRENTSLVITGSSLKLCAEFYSRELGILLCRCAAVVCCRCSPEQKAQLVELVQICENPKRVAAVGDGGNDVSMILKAHAGIGLEAKEGKQASLAADFSILQFSQLVTLILVHGRYAYRRSASISAFIFHRGLIISVIQVIYSCFYQYKTNAIYQGALSVGYSTFYTSLPVFALVLDRDISARVALMYPELYKELSKSRLLSFKIFFMWLIISIYQGCTIMFGSLFMFHTALTDIVAISFTVLIFTELITVGLTVHSWHWGILVSELVSVLVYAASMFVLSGYFPVEFITTWSFWWKTLALTGISCLPLYLVKCLSQRIAPSTHAIVQQSELTSVK